MTRQTRAREVSDALARSTARIQEIHRLVSEHNRGGSPQHASVSPNRREVESPELLMSPALPRQPPVEVQLSPVRVEDGVVPISVPLGVPTSVTSLAVNPLDYIKEIPIGGELSPVMPRMEGDLASPPHASLVAPIPHREPMMSRIVPFEYVIPPGRTSPLLPRNGTPVGVVESHVPPSQYSRGARPRHNTSTSQVFKGYYSGKPKMARQDTVSETAAGWANFVCSISCKYFIF